MPSCETCSRTICGRSSVQASASIWRKPLPTFENASKRCAPRRLIQCHSCPTRMRTSRSGTPNALRVSRSCARVRPASDGFPAAAAGRGTSAVFSMTPANAEASAAPGVACVRVRALSGDAVAMMVRYPIGSGLDIGARRRKREVRL